MKINDGTFNELARNLTRKYGADKVIVNTTDQTIKIKYGSRSCMKLTIERV